MGTIKKVGNVNIYEVKPNGEVRGGLIVIHEVWGLTDHIKDVAERFAAEGFYVIAPDLVSETDIAKYATPQMQKDLFDPKKRSAVQPKLRELMAPMQSPEFAKLTNERVQRCFDYVYDLPETKQKVAVVGFCFGGSYSFNLAVQEPRLAAAVPFYGHSNHSSEELQAVSCPILAFYGEQDERLIEALPKVEANMAEADNDFTSQVYPNTGHAFFNDTNPFAHDADAAEDAWQKTLEFLAANIE